MQMSGRNWLFIFYPLYISRTQLEDHRNDDDDEADDSAEMGERLATHFQKQKETLILVGTQNRKYSEDLRNL